MRTAGLVLFLAAFARAQTDLEKRLSELVPRLGSDDPRERAVAARAIFALGEDSVEALERIRTQDPEVARALRALIRRTKTLKLHIVAPTGIQRIGSPLVVEAQLDNDTDETLLVALTARSGRGRGTMSGFLVKVNGKEQRLRPDQVELIEPQDRQLILEPGDTMRVSIKLDGKDSPLRRPGDIRMSVVFNGFLARAVMGGRRAQSWEMHAVPGGALETPTVTIRARGRTPQQLDAALRSRDGKTFRSALAELELREDAQVLAVLRRHIDNPFLRLRAVTRIGAAAKADDMELLRSIAGSRGEQIEVRIAAVEGLGNYTHRKARSRLVSLAQNARLRSAAVRALCRHKRAQTIDCFVRLLQGQYHEGQWSSDALAAILKWTGRLVENRESEIDAFERWWRKNRQAWIRANS